MGLEPHDLRVMSPTSYQLLYPAIYSVKETFEKKSGAGNRARTGTGLLVPPDFKSGASAYSATPAHVFFINGLYYTTCLYKCQYFFGFFIRYHSFSYGKISYNLIFYDFLLKLLFKKAII